MRFITEFEMLKNDWVGMKLENYQANSKLYLGVLIAQAFGWQNPVNNDSLHYSLEIEAFPMDRWVEFKEKILDMKLYYESDVKVIEQYIQELESFGNPVISK